MWAQQGHGVSAVDLDRMEIWQVACMFGLHKPGRRATTGGADPLAARMAAVRAGGGSMSDRAAFAALGTAVDADAGGSLHDVAQRIDGE